ncbi:2-phosphoglycolate phosphatase [Dacryopinax primogenitus]|uniref:4-nitrophenylphosphatase n=1 Tax=Dacryopinax primogenitus (strain DJM 731) TaxID=1858805 RepID=M5GBT6_DACPD|nr:2-phosphoglycolate phosphatase [Dacryopinax primogenitus]EJU01483.1 2-phosphoglycolate phosphatase [Dacryopinax primogenitus]
MAYLTTPEDISTLLKYDTFLFDCDGVLWQGDVLIPGAKEALAFLREQKKRIIFVTNNATKSRKAYKKKFDVLGIEATEEEVFGSAYATAVYCSTVLNLQPTDRVYIIGMSGIEEELSAEGIQYTGGSDPLDCRAGPYELDAFTDDPSVKAVIVGLDQYLTYTKISKALQYLVRNEGCHFIATNDDSTYPAKLGILPGAGSMSAPLTYILKRSPVSIGKPNKTMLDCIVAKQHLDRHKTLMIGDRLETDIKFGIEGGIDTCLVMTGIAKPEDVGGPNASDIKPTYVMRTVGDLVQLADS